MDLLEESKINQILQHTSIDAFVYLYGKSIGKEYDFNNKADIEMALIVNGYLNASLLPTDKGKALLKSVLGSEVSKKVDTIDFNKLHERLQKELKVLTGRNQKVVDGKWSFLPNSVDLRARLVDFNKLYKVNDWEKIEKLLILHIQKAHKANFEKVRLIKYYILGQNSKGSDLFTDYENFSEKQEITTKETGVFNL